MSAPCSSKTERRQSATLLRVFRKVHARRCMLLMRFNDDRTDLQAAAEVLRHLFADQDFRTLLRQQDIHSMPADLHRRMRAIDDTA